MMIEFLNSGGVYAIVGVVVVAVASLLGLVLFASREEKFEDVVAAQKKEREALIEYLTSGSKATKNKKKQYKKKSKLVSKVSDKIEEFELIAEPQEQVQDDALPVTDDGPTTDVSVLQPTQEEIPKKKKHGKKGKKTPKTEIVEEVVSVEEDIVVEAASYEQETVPDSNYPEPNGFTVAEQVSSQQNGDIQKLVDGIVPEINKDESTEKEQIAGKEQTPVTTGKKSKSKKSKGSRGPKDEEIKSLTLPQFLKEVESMQLGTDEVQIVIDALFDKQNELHQWKKPNQKNEQKIDLRSKVQELEGQLEEERRTSQLTAQKLKDARNDLNYERSQSQVYQSQANTKMGQQTKEIQALQKRMETSHEKHLAELQSAQTQIQRMQELIDGNSSVEVSRLKEEIAHLQKASMRVKQLMEDNQSLISELNQVQQTNKQLRVEVDTSVSQMSAYEAEMTKLRLDKGETENAMTKRLHEVNDQLLRSEAKNQSLSESFEGVQKELEELRNAQIEQAQRALGETTVDGGDSSAIQSLLDDATKELGELKTSVKNAEERLRDAEESKDEKEKHINKLEARIIELESKETLSEESEQVQINGIAPRNELDSEQDVSVMKEKETINALTCELDLTKEEVQRIKEEKDNIISHLEQEMEKLKGEITHTPTAEVEDLKTDILERKDELKKIEAIVEQLKAKNNELREKNWKAIDAVGVAEGNAKQQLKELELTTVEFLGSVHPDVKIDKGEPLTKIFQKYKLDVESLLTKNNNNDELETIKDENQRLHLKVKELSSVKDSSNIANCKIDELEEKLEKAVTVEKNALLQAEHYKKTLEETESMLTKLKDGVEAEVTSWKDKNGALMVQLKEAEEKLEALKDQGENLKEVEEKVQSLENQIKEAEEKSENLENEIKELKEAQPTSNNAEIVSELKLKIENLEKQLMAESEKFNTLKEETKKSADVSNTDATTISELREKVTELQEKIKQIQESSYVIQTDTEKDDKIKKLMEENAQLQEDLKEERDRVIVDVEIPGGSREELKRNLTSAKEELEQEKKGKEDLEQTLKQVKEELESLKANAEVKEKEFLEAQEKTKEIEDKYNLASERLAIAEEKVKELENENLSKSQQIEKEISDAMTQSTGNPGSPQREVGRPLTQVIDELKTTLSDNEKALEAEKQANRQLRIQLNSLTSAAAAHGTSV